MKKYLKFNKLKISPFSNKNVNFEDFVKQKYKKEDIKTEQYKKTEETINNTSRKSRRSHIYFESKRVSLVNTVKNELAFFKLQADCDINELRHKYLTLAKLYHPDVKKNDQYSNMQFTKIQEAYEKLKVYCETRDEILETEDNVDENGNVFVSNIAVDFNEYCYEDKKDIIKQLCKYY